MCIWQRVAKLVSHTFHRLVKPYAYICEKLRMMFLFVAVKTQWWIYTVVCLRKHVCEPNIIVSKSCRNRQICVGWFSLYFNDPRTWTTYWSPWPAPFNKLIVSPSATKEQFWWSPYYSVPLQSLITLSKPQDSPILLLPYFFSCCEDSNSHSLKKLIGLICNWAATLTHSLLS